MILRSFSLLVALGSLLWADGALAMGTLSRKKCNFDAIVFDIGSGASKSYKYNIDLCNHELDFDILDSKVVHMQYQECISNSKGEVITASCLNNGQQSVEEFKRYYGVDCHNSLCFGVATAWARNAKNADDILKIYKNNGISISVIDQVQEGSLSFEAAIQVIDPKLRHKALVFDLGGGSHQISYYDTNNNIEIYLGALGNSNFYQKIVDKFGKDYLFSRPDGFFKAEVLHEVIEYANKIVGRKAKVAIDIEYTHIYGLGRSIYNYFRENLDTDIVVRKSELFELIYKFSAMSQAEAQEKFHLNAHSFTPYMQSALILVYSILDSLELEELNLMSTQMTDTLIRNYVKDMKLHKGSY